MELQCINCNKEVQATLVTGDVIYPHRPDLKNRNFYKCPLCGEYVGCHPNTDKPLGCIPSKGLRQARIKVHNKLDILWKTGKYKRADIYKTLSNHFGYEYHNGNTKTIAECEEAIKVLENNYGGECGMKTEEEKLEIYSVISKYNLEEYKQMQLLIIIAEKLIDIKYLLKDKNEVK